MNRKGIYKVPSTGLKAKTSGNIPDPKTELRYTGRGTSLTDPEELFLITEGTYTFSYLLDGIEENRMLGGPFVPHGMLKGKETYCDAAITATDTTFTPLTHRTADNQLIFETGGYYLVMDRRPKPEEAADVFNVSALNAEIIQLGTYVADTAPISLNGATQFANNHPQWACIQKIVALPASYNLNTSEYGWIYQQEQPTAPSSVTAIDGGSQTIDVTFTESTDKVCGAYMVIVLKSGGSLSQYFAPETAPEYVLPTQISGTDTILAPDSGSITDNGTTLTIEALDRYYNPSTGAVAAIIAGTYYVGVAVLTSTTLDENLRMSDWTFSTAVTVA